MNRRKLFGFMVAAPFAVKAALTSNLIEPAVVETLPLEILPLTAYTAYPSALWPGLVTWYRDHYEEWSDDDWAKAP